VLFAHERAPIGRAVARVLEADGFEVGTVADAAAARAAMLAQPPDGLVVDVALPGGPGYDLVPFAREHGVAVVVLVASVYRRTSYKRRPTRLYGADDYVEVHHLGDQLPHKLRAHFGLPRPAAVPGHVDAIAEQLRLEGDARLAASSPERLASLIVADVILYNGDLVAEAESGEDARERLRADLDGARQLLAQLQPGADAAGGDAIGDAFHALMQQLWPDVPERVEEAP
jgi:DNA-binding response OmpR family regulator